MELVTEREKIEVLEKELVTEQDLSSEMIIQAKTLRCKHTIMQESIRAFTERNEVLECGLEGSRKTVNEYAIRNELLEKTIIEQAISIALTQRGVNGL